MPCVVPSRVVALIERLFPSHIRRNEGFVLTLGNTGQLMSILALIEEIPHELITLETADYTDLIVGINTLRSAFSQWQMRDEMIRGVPGYGGTDPITLIRRALIKCPDEFPSPGTVSLSFIQPDDLRRNLQLNISAEV